MSGLIWVQNICIDQKQMTKFTTGRQKLTIKAPTKNVSEKIVCISCLLQIIASHELSTEANSMDQDQSAPSEQSDLGLHCLSKKLLKHFSR